ncbi:MAG TPA: hypothetical protein VGF46_01415 [Gaiellales bacterium]
MQLRTVISIAMALVALTCSSEQALAAGAAASPTRSFSSEGVAFRYPKAWKPSPKAWLYAGSFFHLVTYLSTARLHNPCTMPSPNTQSCAPPLGVLPPGGILVTWSRNGFPHWKLAAQPGTSTRLAGHAAKLQIARPGACSYLGASETVTALIASPVSGNWVQMQACLRGSNRIANKQKVLAMLATLRLR